MRTAVSDSEFSAMFHYSSKLFKRFKNFNKTRSKASTELHADKIGFLSILVTSEMHGSTEKVKNESKNPTKINKKANTLRSESLRTLCSDSSIEAVTKLCLNLRSAGKYKRKVKRKKKNSINSGRQKRTQWQ
jgi:hypothetical protein